MVSERMDGTVEVPCPIAEAYWVVPGRLLAGPYPGSFEPARTQARLERFLAAGITVFVDLTGEGEDTPYAPLLAGRARHVRMSIPDLGVCWPDRMREILDVVDLALAMRKGVYVHCLAGLGRTGMVVGCYLVRHGTPGGEALMALKELRRTSSLGEYASPETDAQRAMVLTWKADR